MDGGQIVKLSLLILVLPLVGFVVQIFTSKRWPRQGDFIPTGAMGLAMLLAWDIFIRGVVMPAHGLEKPVQWTRSFGIATRSEVDGAVARAFSAHDANVDGALDERELGGPPLAVADTNGDRKVSRHELATWLGVRQRAWVEVGEALPVDRSRQKGFASTLRFDFGVLIDNLAAIMLVVVTTVSFFVYLYSCGYMRDHHGHPAPRYGRFFAFLSLFSFSMLGLVITDNLFMLFVFWELVGVCSYFLIGFEFEREAAQDAQIKAFMTTRVGDVLFFVGLMIIGGVVGSFSYHDIFSSVKDHVWDAHPWLLTLTALLLFGGAMGKSAQFPLHVWLPDAMEGPTPVSALIHAATMVCAGVYLCARMFPFFAGVPFFGEAASYFDSPALAVVAFTGGFTAIIAATIALCQNDIKKVLAYSTISQLGYMVLGIGVGSFAAGMFHLWTHAFFKALLFLGSGSVIHAMGTNDMRQMGGLRRKMPITHWTFFIGTAAIAGVPFLSGFYSKEAILTQALAFGLYQSGQGRGWYLLPFAFGMLTAGLTAFYMFRIMFMAFWGEPRDEHRFEHAHESPPSMTVPLAVLAVFSLLSAGAFGFRTEWFHTRVSNDLHLAAFKFAGAEPVRSPFEQPKNGEGEAHQAAHGEHEVPYIVFPAKLSEGLREKAHQIPLLLSLFAATLGIGFAWTVFAGPFRYEDLSPQKTWLGAYRRVLERLYYIDDFYWAVAIEPVLRLRLAAARFDRAVIDRCVDGVGETAMWLCTLSETLDRRALGARRGALMGLGATAFALAGLLVAVRLGVERVDTSLGPFGPWSTPRGARAGAAVSVLGALAVAWTLVRSGRSSWANALASAVVLGACGVMGAGVGHKIQMWGRIASEWSPSWVHYLGTHPVRTALAALAGIGLTVGVWAGLGIDGTVRWIAESAVLTAGRVARRVQSGQLQEYLFATIVALAAIIFVVAVA